MDVDLGRLKRWLPLLLILAAAGCVRYQPQPLAPVQSETEFRARSLSDSGLKVFVEKNLTNPPSSWPPKEFDLKLLTLAAFYFHPDLESARARIVSAQSGEVTAGQRPNPSVSILPEYAFNADAGLSPWVAGISWDIPIETAGKRGHRLDQARELTLAARIALAESAWKVRSRLRFALVEKFAAEREFELLGAERDLNAKRVALMTKRLELGEASRFDVNLLETDLQASRIAVRKSETRVADARLAVAAALGLPNTALAGVQLVWPDFEAPIPADKLSGATVQNAGLLNRLDIRRSLREYAAAEAALQLEIANQYPDVHLTPGYQFDQGQHKFSIGPTVTLPILNQNQGGIAQAQAKRNELAADFLALQAQAIQDTEKARMDYQSALAEWTEADSIARDLQTRIEAATQRAMELGEGDRLSLLNVQVQRSAAIRARLEALLKVQSAIGALEDAVQRPIGEADDLGQFPASFETAPERRGVPASGTEAPTLHPSAGILPNKLMIQRVRGSYSTLPCQALKSDLPDEKI